MTQEYLSVKGVCACVKMCHLQSYTYPVYYNIFSVSSVILSFSSWGGKLKDIFFSNLSIVYNFVSVEVF